MAVQVTSTIQTQIANLYISILGRNPEPLGFGNWTDALANNNGTQAALNTITIDFGKSPEFIATYGGQTTSAAITLMYNNVLNRAPDANGLSYWTTQYNTYLSQGNTVSAALALTGNAIITAAAANSGTADQTNIQAKQATAVTAGTSTPTTTVALTTNVDTLNVGPNRVVIGTVGTTPTSTTLQAGDTITGSGSNNMLRVINSNSNLVNGLAGVTLTGVQTLQVQNVVAANGDASIYNLVNTTGVTTVQSTNAVQNAKTLFTNLGAGTAISISGSASGAAGTGFTYANPNSPVNINVNGGLTTIQNIFNASGIINGVASAPTSATLTSTGGVNGIAPNGTPSAQALIRFTSDAVGSDQAAEEVGAGSLTTFTINASTNLLAQLNISDFSIAGVALTVSGAATNVNLGNQGIYRTIDASGLSTGGVTMNVNTTLTSFIGGAGDDFLFNQAGGNAVIRTTAVIDGGAGIDTIAAPLINSGNGAVFKNFEVLFLDREDRGSFDASILTNSVLTGVSIGAALGLGADLTVTNLLANTAGFNVTVTGDAFANTTLDFTAASIAGRADIVNYTFNNRSGIDTANAEVITHQGIELVNIASGGIAGTSNQLTLSDNALQTITITGERDFQLFGLVTPITGNFTIYDNGQGTYGSNLITQLTRIDGSAATGALLIVDRGSSSGLISKAAVTILGGSGDDFISVMTQAAGTAAGAPISFGGDTVTTGAGLDRVEVVRATARSATDPAFTTITDLAIGDSITFIGGGATFNSTAVNVSAATSLVGALNIAIAANDALHRVSYFVFGGNTFMVENAAAGSPTITADDIVVQLTGLVNLSTSVIDPGVGVFVFGTNVLPPV